LGDPEKKTIPDPGSRVKKALDPGSETLVGGALTITWYTGNAEQVGGADLKGVEHLCRIVRIYHCNLDKERFFKLEKRILLKMNMV
jgi:hypothetical protein